VLCCAHAQTYSNTHTEPVATYLLEQYGKDITGFKVTQSVHVEACWPGDPVGETKWLDEIADGNEAGIPQAIVGHCDLSSSDVESILQRHCQSKRMRGIRHMLNYHPDKMVYSEASHDNFLSDPQWLKGLALLEKYNLSFEMHILPRQMHRAAEAVRSVPNVRIMVDHCGLPYERDETTMRVWREGLTELAQFPNVYCKVSGMFATNPQWTQDAVAGVVKPVLDIFSIDRCVFASNFPVDRVNGTFPQLMSALEAILQPYSLEDKKKFFAENARKFYRL